MISAVPEVFRFLGLGGGPVNPLKVKHLAGDLRTGQRRVLQPDIALAALLQATICLDCHNDNERPHHASTVALTVNTSNMKIIHTRIQLHTSTYIGTYSHIPAYLPACLPACLPAYPPTYLHLCMRAYTHTPKTPTCPHACIHM